jgi:transcription elongation factor Elf1
VARGAWRVACGVCRPSFEKMVNTLSDYYKTLKQYQDADADAFEASGKDSDDEPEGRPDHTITFCISFM